MLRQWLILVTEPAIVIIDAMALFIVIAGSLHAFVAALRLLFGSVRGQPIEGRARRALWLTYSRWLVAALTFQLAADIIESSIAPSWEALGMLGAVAVVRTFLNYFLERDMDEIRERQASALLDAQQAQPSTPEGAIR